MKITRLLGKNQRVQIFIDDSYSFSSSINFVLDNQLFVDQNLTEDELFELKNKAYKSIIKQKLFEYSTYGNYSEKELYKKVNQYSKKRYNIDPSEEIFLEALSAIKKSGVYSETNALKNQISIYSMRKKGKNYILSKLIQKGFTKSEIQDALDNLSDKSFKNNLKEFLNKKLPILKTKSKSDYDLRQRLFKAAISKGYSINEIKLAINKLLPKLP